MNKNVKILVCCHKQDIMATDAPYFPIHVGKALSDKNLGIQGDDSGDNISSKNQSFCELTGMYWAWRNLKDVDVIGLCHYRRYFDFHNQGRFGFPHTVFSSSSFDKIDFSIPDSIIEKALKGTVVMTEARNYRQNLIANYSWEHISDDLRILQDIFKTTQPVYMQKAFFKVMWQNNKLMHYNMFIMSWQNFNRYCTWLFNILNQVEARVDISKYNAVQRRIYGYMAERLLNVWMVAEQKKILQKPVIWFADTKDILLHYSYLTYKIRCGLNNLANFLVKPHKQ